MIVRIGTVIIAIAAIGGFAFLYGKAIYDLWRHKREAGSPPTSYVYVATILAGLIGGVAAMMFNEELPRITATDKGGTASSASGAVSPGISPAAPTDANAIRIASERSRTIHPVATRRAFGLRAGGTALVRSISVFSQENVLAAMSAVYMLVYLVVGLAAIVTWVKFGDSNTSDLVKNMALVSIGLFAAILRTLFNIGVSAA